MGAPSSSPDDSGVVAIGSLLDGRYRVDAVLGTGGMGRVYKAEHTGIGRAVAIKVLHARLGGQKEASQRFQREAIASGRLDHPNIVGVSDFGVLEDGSLYLVMEALEGESLGKRLEREKRIHWIQSLAIIRGVLAGLKHAHDKGVVHRDIKPDNVFLAQKDGEEIVKILDFGIAKLYAGNADDPATTRAGLTVGTPAYLSPEQAVGGAITPASDLYSTSVVLYEMLTGRAPFLDTDPLAMLTAHVSRDPPPFAEVAPDLQVPPGLEAVIQHGLAKVSAERIGSSLDYMHKLDEVTRAAGYDLGLAPRASSNLAIPSGAHAIPTPPPGFLTPMPFASHTPMPGQYATPAELGVATTQSADALSQPVPRVTLANIKEPLPRSMKLAGLVIVLVALAAATLYFIFHTTDGKKAVKTPPPLGVRILSPEEIDKSIKAALHDLETGKTCADRKAAIPVLVRLGPDERTIAALRKARHRMRGGLLGIGDSNTNACLKADAEAALESLGANKR